MLIDWFTVGAQALNFLILVWLMKRYLYQPVLQAIDAREQRIAAQIADAAAREATATQEKEEFKRKNTEFDKQRADMLGDALSSKRDELLRSDAKNLHESIVRRTQAEVFAIARKTLTDLAGVSLEERMTAVFASRLQALDAAARGRLAEALKQSAEPALIRSAFELPPAQRAVLQQAINVIFSADIHLRFETAPAIVSGIELSAGGQKATWSIADYLASLEQGVDELLAKPVAPVKAPDAIPA